MAGTELVKYIQDAKKRGFSEEQIAEKLKESGYKQEEIKEAMKAAIPASENAEKATTNLNAQKVGKPLMFAIIAIVLIFIIAILIGPSLIYKLPMREPKPFAIVDISGCIGITNFEEYLYCAINVTPQIKILTPLDCGKVQDQEISLLCEAVLSGKNEDCAKASSPDYCYSIQARDRQDKLKCLAIKEEVYRSNCLESSEQEPRISQYGHYIFLFRN